MFFFCKIEGHVKNECNAFREKKASSTCFKCRLKGHFSNECIKSPIGWNMDLDSFPQLVEDDAQDNLNSTADTNQTNVLKSAPNIGGLDGLFEPGALAKSVVEPESTNKRTTNSPLNVSMEHKKRVSENNDRMNEGLSDSLDDEDDK